MILTSSEIKKQIEKGNIKISDFDEARLNPNSYNLRIADKVYTYKDTLLDLKTIKDAQLDEIPIPTCGLILEPDKLYLAHTYEYTETHNLVPQLDGRSSIGRAGMFVHVTAGFGDIGFCGHWTLEIKVTQPLRIYAFQEICQISYHKVAGKVDKTYKGNYQNNTGVQGSKFEYKSQDVTNNPY